MAINLLSVIAWLLFFVLATDDATGIRKDQIASHNNKYLIRQVVDPDPGKHEYGVCKSWVEAHGYKCEEHHVTTKDGYILSLQRIPSGRSAEHKNVSGTPILLLHGLFMDGLTWLMGSPEESLGYILADAGYDVWIANCRGTKHSLGHAFLSANELEFWNWTWAEIAAFDLPAFVAHVYGFAGKQKLHFIGHSLGTLVALASFCSQDLLGLVRSATLLSPIAFLKRVRPPFIKMGVHFFIPEIYFWMGVHRFYPFGNFVTKHLLKLCRLPGMSCFGLLSAYIGKSCCINRMTARVFLEHGLQATSTKNIIHLAQMIRRGTMAKFDYNDCYENMKHYGQQFPPVYNISQIAHDLPLLLGFGGQDDLSDGGDGMHLYDSLKFHDKEKLEILYQQDYGHDDFIMGVNAKKLIYDAVMAFLKCH